MKASKLIRVIGGVLFLTMLAAPAARAQENADIPVPKSVTIDKSLSKAEAAQLLKTGKLLYAFWNTGKEVYLSQAVSPEFFDNTLPVGRPQGYQGILFASKNFRTAVPDLQCSVEDLIITKGKIVCRQIYTGHNTGPVNGHLASGNAIKFFAIDILHVKNGKVYEDWHLEDNLTFLQQAGVVKL
ncbi:ester cyclase [Pedobacter sp. L105]|uniref:ester cyclase n=1 Tax=Pedobacter sp. L105 TaxID=1641871 RepID=UPI00131C9D64|nr:ester cyclase [Pedobacter sp. L105]